MASSTLLDYLTTTNPVIDDTQSLRGFPSFCHVKDTIELTEWTDFSFETLMECYGHVLRAPASHPFPAVAPPISDLECRIYDEDSLDHLLSRSMIPIVSLSLRRAWDFCYPNYQGHGIDISRGGRARDPTISQGNDSRRTARPLASGNDSTEKTKIHPDWAGLQGTHGTYRNRCPGETKLSTKWKSNDFKEGRESFYWPLAQVMEYSCDHWKTRYGYIITQVELVVLRFSREKIGSGIGAKRSPRGTTTTPAPGPQAHQRNISTTSATSHMSVDRVSAHSRGTSISSEMASVSVNESPGRPSTGAGSYRDSDGGGEMRPVEIKSIPWSNSGPNKMTVKLALWWIHMMAAAPGCDRSVRDIYPPLDSWVLENGVYRHTSAGRISKTKPKGCIISRQPSPERRPPGGPSTPPQRRRMASTPFSPASTSSARSSSSGRMRFNRRSSEEAEESSDELNQGNNKSKSKGKEPKRR